MRQILNNCLKNNHLSNFGGLLAFQRLVDRLFKQDCVLCNAKTDALQPQGLSPQNISAEADYSHVKPSIHAVCRACLNDLPWLANSVCPQCALPSDGHICGSCLNSPPDFDATHAVFLYDYPVDAMMVSFKYGQMLHLSATFGELLSNATAPSSVDLIIPMPMHPARLKERGFNQAQEIAKQLMSAHPQKWDVTSVTRIKLTPPQASLPLKARVSNIKGAFSVNADLTGKRIAIVDDVMTTGASLNELAKTLKKAGASHVECWVVARTLPHR
jgi:ComF family protein